MSAAVKERTGIQVAAPATVPAQASESAAFTQMIERLATNPNVNVETVERLLAAQERVMDRNAKAAYTAALVAMKPELPVIDRRGRIEVRAKDGKGERTGAITQSTAFALWEDIDTALTPILAKHGFVLTFRSGVAQDGKITVTGVLGHRDGHSEETTITLPHDSTGSKNAVQAVGSSTSYGKRYTATLLLNIRTKGEDDDGVKGGAPEELTKDELQQLIDLADEVSADKAKFCGYLSKIWKIEVDSLASIPRARFHDAVKALEAKRGAKK